MNSLLSASSLLSQRSQALLAQLVDAQKVSPAVYNAWKYLLLCFDIPRPSSEEEKIRERLIDVAKIMNLDYAVDSAGNLRIRKPATPGYEDRVRVCVQGHLDMVCSQTAESTHNFDTDPIKAYITEDGKWIKAEDTTLGADNGVGVAVALAMLESCTVHGPLEALFTVEEETTMGGALDLAVAPYLEAQALINGDSEEENSVCVGCAGGAEKMFYLPVERTTMTDDHVAHDIKIHGLCGGHTGCDIHTDRGNAIKFASQICNELFSQVPSFTLIGLKGGNAPNAIPRDCTISVMVSKAEEALFKEKFEQAFSNTLDCYAIQECKAKDIPVAGLSVSAAKQKLGIAFTYLDTSASPAGVPLTRTSTQKILALLEAIPHGVIRYSPTVDNAVDTSNALSVVELPKTPKFDALKEEPTSYVCAETGPKVDAIKIHCFYRSFSDQQLNLVTQKLDNIAFLAKSYVTQHFGYFNGWEPNTASPLFSSTIEAFKTLFPEHGEPHVYSVHAGLECGPIKKQYPNMHAISIGPTILGAHSPDEKLEIRTMEPFIRWTEQILHNLAQVKASEFDKQ